MKKFNVHFVLKSNLHFNITFVDSEGIYILPKVIPNTLSVFTLIVYFPEGGGGKGDGR